MSMEHLENISYKLHLLSLKHFMHSYSISLRKHATFNSLVFITTYASDVFLSNLNKKPSDFYLTIIIHINNDINKTFLMPL